MGYKKRCSIIVALFLSVFLAVPSGSAATYTWSNSISDSMAYFYVGAGWGSVNYNFANYEDYSFNSTYKVGTSSKRQVSYKYSYACPYTCEARFANTYINTSDSSVLKNLSHLSYTAGSYWTMIQPTGTLNAKNSASISSDLGSYINVKTTIGLYVYKSGGWAFVNSQDHYGYIR